MKTIGEIFGPKRQLGRIGIEIEVEGENIPKAAFGIWKCEPDGSLRGDGMEYITKRPVPVGDIKGHMEEMNAEFAKLNAKAFDAHRGSIHMHVNVQPHTVEELFGLLFKWTMIEGLWMHMCGPTRENNLFCTQGGSTGDIQQFCREMLKCHRTDSYHRWPERGKYSSLNTNPVSTYGSVEFRTFASTIDADTVVKYARWCDNMVDVGTSTDLGNLTKEWKSVLDEPLAFVASIFGGDAVNLEYDLIKHFVSEGVEKAAELALVYANHKILGKSKKPEGKQVIANQFRLNGGENLQEAIDRIRGEQNLNWAAPPQPMPRPRVRRPAPGL